MTPEKESALIAAARVYEDKVQAANALREKRDKLNATMQEVRRQFEAMASEAEVAEREMFRIVAEGLPPLPDRYIGGQDKSIGGAPGLSTAFAGINAPNMPSLADIAKQVSAGSALLGPISKYNPN